MVKHTKTGHSPHSSTLVVICVIRLLFVLFYVLFVCKCVLPTGYNTIAVNKYIISYQKQRTNADVLKACGIRDKRPLNSQCEFDKQMNYAFTSTALSMV
jgi:hypothetical protein